VGEVQHGKVGVWGYEGAQGLWIGLSGDDDETMGATRGRGRPPIGLLFPVFSITGACRATRAGVAWIRTMRKEAVALAGLMRDCTPDTRGEPEGYLFVERTGLTSINKRTMGQRSGPSILCDDDTAQAVMGAFGRR
jgi:hypothetical protein